MVTWKEYHLFGHIARLRSSFASLEIVLRVRAYLAHACDDASQNLTYFVCTLWGMIIYLTGHPSSEASKKCSPSGEVCHSSYPSRRLLGYDQDSGSGSPKGSRGHVRTCVWKLYDNPMLAGARVSGNIVGLLSPSCTHTPFLGSHGKDEHPSIVHSDMRMTINTCLSLLSELIASVPGI